MIHFVVEVEGYETRFERLLQKDALFFDTPVDCFFANVNLKRHAVWYVAEEVNQGTDCFFRAAVLVRYVSVVQRVLGTCLVLLLWPWK